MKKSIARPYIRSEAPRQRWSTDLHRYFVQVVEQLGGERKAKPKKILELMGVRRLELSHVKSHLQMYRNKKKEKSKQEKTIAWQRSWWQYEQYLRIYGYIRDNTRLYNNIDEKIAAFTKATKEVSCESLFQSSRIGLNEIGGNEGALKEEVSEGEEELSLELSLGLKF